MTTPPILARVRAELRALPSKNPRWPSDALLLLRDACREAAIHTEVGGQKHAAAAFHDIADAAQALAPLFAPPATDAADRLAQVELALRTEGTP